MNAQTVRPSDVNEVAASALETAVAGQGSSALTWAPDEPFADGYVYGTLTANDGELLQLDCPLDDSSVAVSVRVDPGLTELLSRYGAAAADIPLGSRIEAMTISATGAATGEALVAQWLNVNPIYSHGPVLEVIDGVTMTLQQDHGGTFRRLHFESSTRLVDFRAGEEVSNTSLCQAGNYVFFTALAFDSDLQCIDLYPVVVHQTSVAAETPSAL